VTHWYHYIHLMLLAYKGWMEHVHTHEDNASAVLEHSTVHQNCIVFATQPVFLHARLRDDMDTWPSQHLRFVLREIYLALRVWQLS